MASLLPTTAPRPVLTTEAGVPSAREATAASASGEASSTVTGSAADSTRAEAVHAATAPGGVALRRPRSQRGYALRARHARERGRLSVPGPLSVAHVEQPEDRLVLQVLRQRSTVDLDAAQIAAASALPMSLTVPALDRLVLAGLARVELTRGRRRFGLP